MKIFRGLLSIIALAIAVVGVGEATTVLHIGPSLVAFILAGGNLLGVLGISPKKFSPNTAKIFTELSLFILAGEGAFATYSAGHPTYAPAHLLLVHLIHGGGVLGTLLGIAGSTPQFETEQPASAPVPIPVPAPPPEPPKAA